MRHFNKILSTILAATILLASSPARASAGDYRFESVGRAAKTGDAILIKLRLVHVPDSTPVTNAILIQPRLEMGSGNDAMIAPVSVVPPSEPGLYAVAARPGMDGAWSLSLAAKVPGEAATIRGRIAVILGQ